MLPPCGGRGRGGTELGASGGSGLGQQTAADGEGTAGAVECGGVPWMGAQGSAIKVCKCECVGGCASGRVCEGAQVGGCVRVRVSGVCVRVREWEGVRL